MAKLPTIRRGKRGAAALVAYFVFFGAPAPASAAPAPITSIAAINWSGYALAGNSFAGVTGTFNVPRPRDLTSCLEETAVWVGVDGVDNRDLLQAGVAETTFALPSDNSATPWPAPMSICLRHVNVYAWWEDLPSDPMPLKLPVNPGDRVTVSIFKMSPGWWAVAMHDLTSKQSFLLAQPYGGPQTSVEWVVEAPRVFGIVNDPVPFGSVAFRNLGAEGQVRQLERFSFGSGRVFTSEPGNVTNAAQLIRSGFSVEWARRR